MNLEQQAVKIVKADSTNQLKIAPNASDHWTNIYSYNALNEGGGVRFRVVEADNANDYKTFLSCTYRNHQVGSGTQPVQTQLNWLRTPTSSHHAANKQYVDDHKAKCRTGTSTNPSLATGELFFNTSTQELFIGG